MSIDGALRVQLYVAKHLHANDCVNEEEHGNQQADVRQCLIYIKEYIVYILFDSVQMNFCFTLKD